MEYMEKTQSKIKTRCSVKNCNNAANIYYKDVWFCTEHSEDYANIDDYVKKILKIRRNKQRMEDTNMRHRLSCLRCGFSKNRNSNTLGVYKVYKQKSVLILKCRSCGFEQSFKILEGAPIIKEVV
uniref:Uncharacterized protein n=1 Tax=viral metagenome TaxID=1070528 RepID=A0A6M3JJN9_9ZZZZ